MDRRPGEPREKAVHLYWSALQNGEALIRTTLVMDGLTMGATVEVWVGLGAIDGDGGAEDMVDSVEA
jgi:hypothetical protein